MDVIALEHDFNLTLQWLGSLMVAYNHLEHRIYEALSYLINEHEFQRGDVAVRYLRGFRAMFDQLEELFALKVTDPKVREELKLIRKDIKKHVDTRNMFAHSRLIMPPKKREAVALRIKADDMSNTSHPVTLDQLIAAVKAMGACGNQLSSFFDTHLPSYREARFHAEFNALLSGLLNGSISLE